MNSFVQQIVNQRINQVTAGELLQQAELFHIAISREQAEQIVANVHGQGIDLFNADGQQKLHTIIREAVDQATADELLNRFYSLVDKFS
ncbi:MAG: DUF2624 family protein [Sporolactobacillus sp.]